MSIKAEMANEIHNAKRVQMTKSKAKKWIKALRSGKYLQGRGRLRTKEEWADGVHYSYCCLGVAKEICPAFRQSSGGELLVNSVLPRDVQDQLAAMNDGGRFSFKQIANFIEKSILPFLPSKPKGVK